MIDATKPTTNDRPPGRDAAHRVATLMVGWYTPRWWWRRLSPGKFRRACKFVACSFAAASDNYVPASDLKRPQWFPKRYVYGGKR